MNDILGRMTWLFAKSVAIFLSLWAIRYKADWDYKLSPQAAALRWIVVFVSYFLAASLPGPRLAYVRVSAWLIGISFLCWPNVAYHLNKLFQPWPSIEGFVDSRESTGNGWQIGYNFILGGERYGGFAKVRVEPSCDIETAFPQGKPLVVRYDPHNPECSRLEERGSR